MKEIRFLQAEFRNFLSYGDAWQILTFDEGLNIIQGLIVESGKSNGSGKSSITEIIPFALYGKTIKKLKKAKIPNWYNKKRCEVRLTFLVDGVKYEIRRGIAPNKTELRIEGSIQPAPAHMADFQSRIDVDIIGMDFQTFQNLIYFSPNNTISIINAGKPEKRKFLESLFDLTVYSKKLKVANSKITALDKKIAVTEQRMIINKDNIHRLHLDINEQEIPKIRKYRDKMNGLKLQVEELEKVEFSVTHNELDMAKDLLRSSKLILEGYQEDNRQSVKMIEIAQNGVKQLGDVESQKAKSKELHDKLKTLERGVHFHEYDEHDHKTLDEINKFLEKVQPIITTVNANIVELSGDVHILKSCITSDEENINIAKQKVRADEGMCSNCGQMVTKELLKQTIENEVKEYLQMILDHNEDLVHAEKQVTELTEYRDNLLKQQNEKMMLFDDLTEQYMAYKRFVKDRDQMLERIEDLPDIKDIAKKLKEYQRVMKEEYEKTLEHAHTIHMTEIDVEQRTDRLARIQEDYDKMLKHQDNLKAIKVQLKDSVKYYDEIQILIRKANDERERKEVEIHQLNDDVIQLEKAIRASNSMMDYLNFLKVSLKDENVKQFAISAMIPYLNKQTNFYLSETGFPYIVDIDAWLDVSIRGLGVQEVDYGALSGGEEKTINMAVQLACNDIASMLAKSSLNIMILDEILDSSVDNLGVQDLLNIVRVRQKVGNDSVYIITHRNELTEFTFDSVVRIMNEDKFSHVEVEKR